uniref:Uncharacterized protein n=1 Tax=Rhizophora mucronata TaxID=61149 RepID=A0A2P2L6E6_RHIMU
MAQIPNDVSLPEVTPRKPVIKEGEPKIHIHSTLTSDVQI